MKIFEYVCTRLDIVEDEGDSFKKSILNHINDSLAELSQLIKIENFAIANEDTTIQDLYTETSISPETELLMLSYIGISVRLSFDPPAGTVLNYLEKSRNTIASRITISHNNEGV